MQHRGRPFGQPQAPIHLAHQQQSSVAANLAAAEIGLQHPALQRRKLKPIERTICHRRILRKIRLKHLI
jgi:hypothetical protein